MLMSQTMFLLTSSKIIQRLKSYTACFRYDTYVLRMSSLMGRIYQMCQTYYFFCFNSLELHICYRASISKVCVHSRFRNEIFLFLKSKIIQISYPYVYLIISNTYCFKVRQFVIFCNRVVLMR